VFKKGLSCDVNNYIPISLTRVCCKIMKTLIKGKMLDYLLHSNLISKHQHGFLSRHSTCTQLLKCVNDWTEAINELCSVDVAYINFSKAFDSACRSKLICKHPVHKFSFATTHELYCIYELPSHFAG